MYLDKSYEEFRNDIIKGLQHPYQKSTPSKYLYDNRGSQLFELITDQPEYYPTRTELSILEQNVSKITKKISKEIILIELGSGSSRKTRCLFSEILENQNKLIYFPIDISFNFLDSIVADLESYHENLTVKGIPKDYVSGIKECNNILFESNFNFESSARLILFFGSSIGNFEPEDARDFLKQIRLTMYDDDLLLVGFDLIKEASLLEPAYNDKAGYTADFNLNLLNRINKELGGNFDVNNYEHLAIYNSQHNRIEMHIKSKKDQLINLSGCKDPILIKKNESIHTESSYKYDDYKIEMLATRSGFLVEQIFTDNQKWFNLVLLRPC